MHPLAVVLLFCCGVGLVAAVAVHDKPVAAPVEPSARRKSMPHSDPVLASPPLLSYRAKLIAGAVVGGTAVIVAAPYVIAAAGFGVKGVMGVSFASAFQSAYLGSTVPPAFAALTSWGAAGMGTAAKVVTASVGALAGGAIAAAVASDQKTKAS